MHQAENSSIIAVKHRPLITLIDPLIALGGLGLMLWVVIETLEGYILFFLSFPIPYLGNIVYFFIGLAILVGGLWGVWDTLVRIRNI